MCPPEMRNEHGKHNSFYPTLTLMIDSYVLDDNE